MSFNGSTLSLQVAAPTLTNYISTKTTFAVSSTKIEVANIARFDKPGDVWGVVKAQFDFSGGRIAYKVTDANSGYFAFTQFNGYVIKDVGSSLRPIVDVDVLEIGNTLNLNGEIRVSHTSDTININVQGLFAKAGNGFTLDVAFGGSGNSGNNSLKGDVARDWLYGKAGNDLIWGYGANDKLYGGSGDDRLSGGSGRDYLSGGDGKDLMLGGSGADLLLGGSGGDTLTGGLGTDKFVFTHYKDSGTTDLTRDVISDLTPGEFINLNGIDANALLSGNQDFVLNVPGTFGPGDIQLVVQGNDTLVRMNRDNGPLAEIEILVLNRTDLDIGDFIL